MIDLRGKKILDATCGDRTIWFQKNEPHTVYCDIRKEEWDGWFGTVLNKQGKQKYRHLVIDPDIQCDFTDLPFPDESFHLVVYDPPHIKDLAESSWMRKSYGSLTGEWEPVIQGGVVRVYARSETVGSSDIQMVGYIDLNEGGSKSDRTRAFVRTQEREENEYALDDIHEDGGRMKIRPIGLKEANDYVRINHRHNGATGGHKFSIACFDGDRICGVAIAGRPVARKLDDGKTIEITRVCTDGTRNACSMLYGACTRIAREMGYRKVVTYTLVSESGSSLKASGFINCGEAGGVSWDMPSRHREESRLTLFGEEKKYPTEKKIRWEKRFYET